MWWLSGSKCFLMVVGLVTGVCIVLMLWLPSYMEGSSGLGYLDGYINYDKLSLLMLLLTSVIWLVLCWVARPVDPFIHMSVLSAMMCYIVVHGLVFWLFYELSTLSALYVLMKSSPYPERYSAIWYFGGYLCLGSIPLLYGLMGVCHPSSEEALLASRFLVSLIFLMKVPIPPFHTWLPLAHAEASSPVSVILSGYLMKLGLVGLLRFGVPMMDVKLFRDVMVVLGVFSVFFLFHAYREPDAKRWLAYMSLCDMFCVVLMVWFGSLGADMLGVLYCLGHGLGVSAMFMYIWCAADTIGSRNWSLMGKYCNSVLMLQLVGSTVFLCVAGFPPMPQFVIEVYMFDYIFEVSDYVLLCVFSLFVYGCGLVSLLSLGLLMWSEAQVSSPSRFSPHLVCMTYLVLYSFFFMLVF